MSDEFIRIKDIGRDRRRKQIKILGKGFLTVSKAFGKGFAETARSTARAFTGGTQEEQIARLMKQEEKLKLRVKVSKQRAKLARLKRKSGSGFGGFQDFATKLSKTEFGKKGLGGDISLGKKRKGKRTDFMF